MSNYSRKPSIKIPCPICGKEQFERGLKAHIRLKHKLKVTEQVTEIVEKKYETTQVTTQVVPAEKPVKSTISKTTQVVKKNNELLKSGGAISEKTQNYQPNHDAFRKWYVRGKEFNTQADALEWLKTNTICGYCNVLLVDKRCPHCSRTFHD
jgi:hypothetical protein